MAQKKIHDTPSTRVMAYRKRRMEGMKRVEIWLRDDELMDLDAMAEETGISRARVVGQLLLERTGRATSSDGDAQPEPSATSPIPEELAVAVVQPPVALSTDTASIPSTTPPPVEIACVQPATSTPPDASSLLPSTAPHPIETAPMPVKTVPIAPAPIPIKPMKNPDRHHIQRGQLVFLANLQNNPD